MNRTIVTTGVICVLTLMTHLLIVSFERNATVSGVLDTQIGANRILKSQVEELVYTVELRESEIYNRGFEAGKTQMGLALMNNEALAGYKEGYHAALEQFGDTAGTWPKGLPRLPDPSELPNLPFPTQGLTKGDGQ